ncbi:MAG: phosphate ABC transporter permease [Clostridia bacterium BRH_c25]|nr:MAG: phosphate ABC transporter permease [Clostridia bacterium BRH_c25]
MISNAKSNYKMRKLKNRLFHGVILLSTLFGVIILVVLLTDILKSGLDRLSIDFLKSFPSRFPEKAGIKSALAGSLWVILLTALFAFPIGVGTAVYLEEYAKKSWFSTLLQLNISNLAGVPSIVYGLLGLSVFVRLLGFGRSILSGALTLALLILPVIIVASQEAIKSVPESLKHGAYALGASKWQVIRTIVIPTAMPGILTGTILAISRALGEAAPLIMVGAMGYVAFLPQGIVDSYTTLPIQIFNWTSRPQEAFHELASAGIIILLVLLLSVNASAILLRNKFQKRM